LAFNAAFGMALTTAMFSIFYLKERVSRAKLLQFLSGVNKFVFWLTSFAIDYLQFIVISVLFLAVLGAYGTKSYNSFEELFRNFTVFASFGFAVLPYTYFLSLSYDTPTTGLVKLALIYIITGDFMFITFFVFNIKFLDLGKVAKPFGQFSYTFPHYSFARGISNLYITHSKIHECNELCDGIKACSDHSVSAFCDTPGANTTYIDAVTTFSEACCDISNFYSFDENGLGMSLVSLILTGVTSFALLFITDFEIFKKIRENFKNDQKW
jgi:ATP-binding cassette, subfamily A (ABC1), member 3